MIKKFSCILYVCVCFYPVVASGQEPNIYQPSQMQTDLNKFKHALEYAHPGLYTHRTPDDFDAYFGELVEETSNPMESLEFYKVVLRLIAFLHDGHTRVFATDELRAHIGAQKLLPFHSTIKNERIFITRNLSTDNIPDGSEVISISGILSNAILKELEQYFAGDGLSKSPIHYRFGSSYNSFYRVFPLIFGFYPAYDLVIRDYQSGEIKEVEVSAVSSGDFRSTEFEKYGDHLHTASMEEVLAQDAFWFDLHKGNHYAYMKINRFFKESYYEPEDTYSDFYREAFRQIEENNIPNLIIDIRSNGGGIGSNTAHLLQYLTNQSFVPTKEISMLGNDEYYRAITSDSLKLDEYFGLKSTPEGKYIVTKSDNISELKQFDPIQQYHFDGSVYVLIDGGTLSAAAMAAGLLQQYTDAVFIGEETGGHAGMSNGIRQLSISGDSTDVSINLPLLHSEFDVNENLKKRGVVPDYSISNSIHDIINGKDAVLEFVLNIIDR